MKRRTYLALVGALAGLAGCSSEESPATSPTGTTTRPTPTPTPTDEPTPTPPPTETPTTYPHTSAPCEESGGVELSLRAYDPAADLPLRTDDPQRRLVAAAVADGAVEASTYADLPPIRDGTHVEHEGAYYRIGATGTDATELPARVLTLSWETGREPPAGATVVAFGDLPAADREALRFAVYGPPYGRESRRELPEQGLRRTDTPVPYPDGTDGSTLEPFETTWVRWDGRAYRVRPGTTTTMTRYTYRLSVAEVARDAAAFREHVAVEYLVELSDLPDGEREVLAAAAEDGRYLGCPPLSDDLTALLERLTGENDLPPPDGGEWYVAFEGERYGLSVYRY